MPTIEHGIPMPKADGRGIYHRKLKMSPWAKLIQQMKYADSVRLNLADYRLLRQAARHAAIGIATKKLDASTWRIWRVD